MWGVNKYNWNYQTFTPSVSSFLSNVELWVDAYGLNTRMTIYKESDPTTPLASAQFPGESDG
ncbi:hypothetical protein DMN77_11025 [Paenibacillus sp. 79R4]|nr:hypothetical protein [Paenibacillus sp. 79R4]